MKIDGDGGEVEEVENLDVDVTDSELACLNTEVNDGDLLNLDIDVRDGELAKMNTDVRTTKPNGRPM